MTTGRIFSLGPNFEWGNAASNFYEQFSSEEQNEVFDLISGVFVRFLDEVRVGKESNELKRLRSGDMVSVESKNSTFRVIFKRDEEGGILQIVDIIRRDQIEKLRALPEDRRE